MKLKRLKELRIENNLTQESIAKILQIDRATYTSFEIGRDTIPLERLNIFVNHFNTTFDYLFEFNDNKKQYENYNNNLDIKVISKKLKETRKTNKYTQESIAKILNTNHSVWCRYEQGKFLINTSFLYSYAKKLNISADYLLGKIDYKP